eukprot:1488273-Ditylum_brightwellii.AAC.1
MESITEPTHANLQQTLSGPGPPDHNKPYATQPNHLRYNYQTKYPTIDWKPYKSLFTEQTKIGWQQLQYGCWTKQWNKTQQQYKPKMQTKTTSKTKGPIWLGQIIKAT